MISESELGLSHMFLVKEESKCSELDWKIFLDNAQQTEMKTFFKSIKKKKQKKNRIYNQQLTNNEHD